MNNTFPTEPTNTTTEAIRDTTDWSGLTTAQRIRHLEIEGYVLLPDLIPPAELEEIRQEVNRLPTQGTDYSENQRSCSDHQPGSVSRKLSQRQP